ncbi:MAG: hypothetical protein IJJ95_00495, partial [Spirochaetales bacterium]|nr:hypothetical protein [Spirochaetales bacterium]
MRKNQIGAVRWALVIYDLLVMAAAAIVVFLFMHGAEGMNKEGLIMNLALFCICIFTARLIGNVYKQIWRYGGTQGYVRMIFTEAIGFVAYFLISRMSPVENYAVIRMTAFVTLDLLGVLVTRMMYRYCFKCGTQKTLWGRFLLLLLRV